MIRTTTIAAALTLAMMIGAYSWPLASALWRNRSP